VLAAADQEVTVSFPSVASGTPNLYVLEERGNGCGAGDCVAFGFSTVTFSARAGVTYYILAEGFQGSVATFDLSVACR
jgi:hypothetical protein